MLKVECDMSYSYLPTVDEWMLVARYYLEGMQVDEHTWYDKNKDTITFLAHVHWSALTCRLLAPALPGPSLEQLPLPGLEGIEDELPF